MALVKNTKHRAKLILIHMLNYFPELWFVAKLKYLKLRYGDLNKVPPDVFSRVVGPLVKGGEQGAEDLNNVIQFSSAAKMICDKLEIDYRESTVCIITAKFITGELNDADLHESWEEYIKEPKRGNLILNLMIKAEDITQADIDRKFPLASQARDDFRQWLNTL